MPKHSHSLAHLTNQELIEEVKTLAGQERVATVQLIASLGELDVRRLYLGEGFPSLFTYCMQCLHLSEHAAYSRIEVARAALRPLPLVPPSIRKLPAPAPDVQRAPAAPSAPQISVAPTAPTPAHVELARSAGPFVHRALVSPLAPERFKVQITISRETHDRLRRVQDLLRHSVPSGDPAEIFDRGLTLLEADLEKKKLAHTDRPRPAAKAAAGSRHVPAAARRAVWKARSGRSLRSALAAEHAEAAVRRSHGPQR